MTETAGNIPFDVSPLELAYTLNQLLTVGSVSVTRTTVYNGYSWLVTFDGCKVVSGVDVCNEGAVALLKAQVNSPFTGKVTVNQVIRGNGASNMCGENNNMTCTAYVNSLTSSPPYSFLLSHLTTGRPYYVRVAARNVLGYGYPALSQPEFQTPTFRPPGSPPPVRLVVSTSTTITVEWSLPRYNGGAEVTGYELYIEDWAGGDPKLIFDGTDQPSVTSFTVGNVPLIDNTITISPGKSYRFLVRAINYCVAGSDKVACKGMFSEASVFAARGPRVPLPPMTPYRSSSSSINGGTITNPLGSITIRWSASIDNGGSPITGYSVWMAAPGQSYVETPVSLCAGGDSPSISALCRANGNLTLEHSAPSLSIGKLSLAYFLLVFLI